MKTIRTVEQMMSKINTLRDKKIGFVPTMGYLHEGHLTLVDEARKENDIVVMSIFVNPLQFGPNEDFERYPRDEARDASLAEKHGVDLLFLPSADQMYPTDFSIKMKITSKTDVLCGRSRPGHFDGVITVLTKLFHIVQPTNAYFGLKDAQQFAVVQTLIEQLNFPIQLVGIPTVREDDGLAKSSRNVYLSVDERQEAISLYKGLLHGQKRIQDGIKDAKTIEKEVTSFIKKHTTAKIDYVEILTYPNLTRTETINEQIIIAVAAFYEKARLIDNLILEKDGTIVSRIGEGGN